MSLLRRFAKVLPSSLRYRLTSLLWSQMDLSAQVDGRLRLTVQGRTDWDTLNELFVKGEYDHAIYSTIGGNTNGCHTVLRVLDLGANVGFFALRVSALATALSVPLEMLHVVSVEGSRRNYARLVASANRWRSAWPSFQCIHGLVGERTGSAFLYDTTAHVTTTTKGYGSGEQVPFFDLTKLLSNVSEWDLIKCDIEGAEQDFLSNYGDLLKCTKRIVIEFHHELVDLELCRRILREAGYAGPRLLSQGDTPTGKRSVEFYTRLTGGEPDPL